MTKKYLDNLSYKIIGCAIEVHKALGPGLLESVYHKCLLHELKLQGIACSSQLVVPVNYKNIELDCSLRLDILVEDLIVVELKAVDFMIPIYDAQILTYMKLMEKPKGTLINFNCINIVKEGQKTFVNELYAALPNE